jgi:hypothetical protein
MLRFNLFGSTWIMWRAMLRDCRRLAEGAQMVFWNCFAQSLIVMKLPSAQNYAIGWNGPTDLQSRGVHDKYAGILGWVHARSTVPFGYKGVAVMGDGYIESPTAPVAPRSLYTQQRRDRLGDGAVAALADRPILERGK